MPTTKVQEEAISNHQQTLLWQNRHRYRRLPQISGTAVAADIEDPIFDLALDQGASFSWMPSGEGRSGT